MSRSIAQFALFLLTATAIVAAWHGYLWLRLVRSTALPAPWHRIGSLVILAMAVAMPLSFVVFRAVPRFVAAPLAAIVFGWMGLAFFLFVLLLLTETVRAGASIAGLVGSTSYDPQRRLVLARTLAGVAAVGALGLSAFAVFGALRQVAVRRVGVILRRLPRKWSGMRIVQLTDLHIGATIGGTWLKDVVARVNALEPDIVAITGDLVDGSVDELREHVAHLGDLRAPHGVYFVTGNHEYYSGADEWLVELGRLGIRVLRNERVTIGDGDDAFELAGVDDLSADRYEGHGADLARALAGYDPARELVLLAHQPKQFLEAAAAGVGLQLSGHTHGGQIAPWNWMVKLAQPYVAGLSELGGAQIYVSRGTGYWGPPMRLGAPAEITLVELFAAG